MGDVSLGMVVRIRFSSRESEGHQENHLERLGVLPRRGSWYLTPCLTLCASLYRKHMYLKLFNPYSSHTVLVFWFFNFICGALRLAQGHGDGKQKT